MPNCMAGAATMQICFKQGFPACRCEQSFPTGLCSALQQIDSRACTSSQQLTQSIPVQLTGCNDAVPVPFAVKSYVQFCCIAGYCIDNSRAARYKAAVHAAVTCTSSEQHDRQHDGPDLTLQKLSRECAASEMITMSSNKDRQCCGPAAAEQKCQSCMLPLD